MFGISEHTQLSVHISTQCVLGEHALDSQLDNAFGVSLLQFFKIGRFEVTDIPCVVMVHLVLGFITCDHHLRGINYDHVVASIDMRRVDGLVLSAQTSRAFGSYVTQGLACGINNEPLTFYLCGLGADGSLVHLGESQ